MLVHKENYRLLDLNALVAREEVEWPERRSTCGNGTRYRSKTCPEPRSMALRWPLLRTPGDAKNARIHRSPNRHFGWPTTADKGALQARRVTSSMTVVALKALPSEDISR